MQGKILVIGSGGQIGTELTSGLANVYGNENVIATDIRGNADGEVEFFELDVLDKARLFSLTKEKNIKQVYLLAAMLSATAEKKPLAAWELNIQGLFNVLDLAKEGNIEKVFWPSSIAVFGATTPKHFTPQHTITEPSTVYGVSKLAGERWCEYYAKKFKVDVRSLRYPGLISYTTPPGGGTTDYAVQIYHEAIRNKHYNCYLEENTELPMMYMPDAIRATIELMEAPEEKISIRSSYNLAAMSFSPKEIAQSIMEYIPDFNLSCNPDFRQQIAETWPASIDDSSARKDWNWQHSFDLKSMTKDMIDNLKKRVGQTEKSGVNY